jgi:hypothetical protein
MRSNDGSVVGFGGEVLPVGLLFTVVRVVWTPLYYESPWPRTSQTEALTHEIAGEVITEMTVLAKLVARALLSQVIRK